VNAQQLLAAGWSRREVAAELSVKIDTLRKAIQQGRLVEPLPMTTLSGLTAELIVVPRIPFP
jgi:hypothetical protein